MQKGELGYRKDERIYKEWGLNIQKGRSLGNANGVQKRGTLMLKRLTVLEKGV